MRKILLLLCILSITISAKAQIFGKHYDEGFYYDPAGVKHTGLISWSPPHKSIFSGSGDYIYFKPEKKAEKIKLKNTQIKSFALRDDSVKMDSFVVSVNKEFKNAPFLQVLLDNDVKIYSFAEMASSGGMTTPGAGGTMIVGPGYSYINTKYYYGSNPNDVISLTKKNFIEVMSKIMADKPDVVEKIKTKKLRYKMLGDLIELYKTGKMPPERIKQPDDVYN
jgi:hypothetical protein